MPGGLTKYHSQADGVVALLKLRRMLWEVYSKVSAA